MKLIILSTLLLASTVTWADDNTDFSSLDLFGVAPFEYNIDAVDTYWLDFMAERFSYLAESESEVRVVVTNMLMATGSYADTYLVYLIAEQSGKTEEEIVALFERNMTRGWGHLAKLVGIVPGSSDFKNLKTRNDLAIAPGSNRSKNGNRGRNGEGKGNKGNSKN